MNREKNTKPAGHREGCSCEFCTLYRLRIEMSGYIEALVRIEANIGAVLPDLSNEEVWTRTRLINTLKKLHVAAQKALAPSVPSPEPVLDYCPHYPECACRCTCHRYPDINHKGLLCCGHADERPGQPKKFPECGTCGRTDGTHSYECKRC